MPYTDYDREEEERFTEIDAERALDDLALLKKAEAEMQEQLEWLTNSLGYSDALSIHDIKDARGCITDMFADCFHKVRERCDHVLTNYSDGYHSEVQSYWASTRL